MATPDKATLRTQCRFGFARGKAVESLSKPVADFLDSYQVKNADTVAKRIQRQTETIALLTRITVRTANRGQGVGAALLSRFVRQAAAAGADGVLLVCDCAEEQPRGFDLKRWYEQAGFVAIGTSANGPVMLKTLR